MCSIAGASCGFTSGAIAVAAAAAAATPGAAAIDVAPSSTVPRAALSPPPIAAVNSGCPVVMTGTRKCSDSVVVMIGMRAPPPTEATATRSAARIPLRSRFSCYDTDEVGERRADRLVELVAGQSHVTAMPGQLGHQ